MWLRTAESGTFKIEKDYTKEREEVPAKSGWYIIERRENNKVIICYYDEFSDFWWNDEEFTEIRKD